MIQAQRPGPARRARHQARTLAEALGDEMDQPARGRIQPLPPLDFAHTHDVTESVSSRSGTLVACEQPDVPSLVPALGPSATTIPSVGAAHLTCFPEESCSSPPLGESVGTVITAPPTRVTPRMCAESCRRSRRCNASNRRSGAGESDARAHPHTLAPVSSHLTLGTPSSQLGERHIDDRGRMSISGRILHLEHQPQKEQQ